MKKVYSQSTIEKCLEAASQDLSIPVKQLKYEILEEKRFLFKKKVTIEVDIPEEDIEFENMEYKQDDPQVNEKDGSIKIVDGQIIVKNPKEGGNPAVIIVGNELKVIVDGNEVKGKEEVFEESKIEVKFDEAVPVRELKITLSEDYMEAHALILYKPQLVYKLKDKKENISMILETEVVSQIDPPKYSIEEVKKELNNNKVVYGIIEENLKECVKNGGIKVLVAKGQPAIDGQNDTIEIKFKFDSSLQNLKEDKGGNIDFKSIGSVEAVRRGDIIAVKHLGEEGQDGCDLTGRIKKSKPAKKLRLKAGAGCTINDENTVVASIDGKPCIKSNIFYVYQVHEVRGDVDLKTGNIKFIGDIIVYGNVKEGMEIECGNFLNIEKDVERAKIKSWGNINIKGNLIAASLFGGGDDVKKLKALKDLEGLKEQLKELTKAVEEIKKYKLLGENRKDGEIIKILIENKYKILPKLCINVVTDLMLQDDDSIIQNNRNLIELIKSKLLGIGPISINHYSELDFIVNSIEEIVVLTKNTLTIPVDVKIAYCQDSNIQSSGNVVITGRGEYISDITANGSIYFTQEKSVARGGVLRAKNEIKCRVVGSTAGVSTKLQVDKEGHIWVDTAYQNTIFLVGCREFILDVPSKNIHAYLGNKDDIIVDRLKL